MTRWKAASIHLAASALVIGTIAAFVVMLWFPPALWAMSGVMGLVGLIAAVDVTLGPLLTLIVYRAGKKSLKFDLAVIVLLQMAVLAYGLHILAQNRPIFLVAGNDRLDLVLTQEVADEDLALAPVKWRKRSWTGPLLVGAKPPDALALREQLMFDGLAGRDLQHQPVFFVDIDTVLPGLLTRARPIAGLVPHLTTAEQNRLERAARGHALGDLRYLDFVSARGSAVMLVTADDELGKPVAIDAYVARMRRPSVD